MIVKVKVFPKSRKEEVIETKSGKLEIYIRAEAKRGEANMRVLELLKERYPESRGMRIIKGHTTPNKTIEVFGPEVSLL